LETFADDEPRISSKIGEIFKTLGLKVATQRFEYRAAGKSYGGENTYGVLHAPRGDATEAIVLVAAWINMDGELNRSGVALALTLAHYFKSTPPWTFPRLRERALSRC
jgi:GPI-anchor transamidase subunit GAA1